ncbi:hypothetical protein PABG_07101 [Paracoccidioides brasiliensis Pb03]|nr:hypothetical protein PABG_07101 [Paracoccidioides brasiliensis Pb03]
MAHIDNRVIHIDSDKDETIERTLKMIENPSTTVFTDASVTNLGMQSTMHFSSHGNRTSVPQASKVTRVEPLQHRTYIIISDSRSALENIKNSSKQSGQQIVYSILDTTKQMKETLRVNI